METRALGRVPADLSTMGTSFLEDGGNRSIEPSKFLNDLGKAEIFTREFFNWNFTQNMRTFLLNVLLG